MIIKIELFEGPNHKEPTKRGIQSNIDALQRAIDGKSLSMDFVLLIDTKSIL